VNLDLGKDMIIYSGLGFALLKTEKGLYSCGRNNFG
jgi:hypothetical protein